MDNSKGHTLFLHIELRNVFMCKNYVFLKSFMFLYVQQRLVFVHEKVRDLHLRCHLMGSRWVNFLIFSAVFNTLV